MSIKILVFFTLLSIPYKYTCISRVNKKFFEGKLRYQFRTQFIP